MQNEKGELKQKMEQQKVALLKEIEEYKEEVVKLEDENQDLSRQLMLQKSTQECLESESKLLETKLRKMQDRYDSRLQSQEEIIQKLTKENTDYRHKNELLKIDISDLQFKVNRYENSEKLRNSNPELEELPLKMMEDRIKALNEEYDQLYSSVDGYINKI